MSKNDTLNPVEIALDRLEKKVYALEKCNKKILDLRKFAILQASRQGFRAGAEARENQIRELVIGVVMRHLANITACELMAELDKTIDNLPLPEMTDEATP